jgi:3-dehydroquinate dehydratase type I
MPSGLAIGPVALGVAPRLVAAGGDTELAALRAAEGAHLVEVRADLFAKPEPAGLARALEALRGGGRPIILTVRAGDEGGKPLPDRRRTELYRAGLPYADAVDVEIAAAIAGDVVSQARGAGRTVILSVHVLDATPPAAALLALVDRGFALGADVVKLATHAAGLDHLRTLLAVTLAARERGVVTLATGPVGPLSRIVLPAAGSLLTYAHAGRPTAPGSGQPSVAELAALLARLFPAS